MAATATDGWKLESFLDALILELDRAQDTLSFKGLTRRLSYTVQDVSVDLQVFPAFERGRLRFAVAKPGDGNASRISFQLGSITDRQIRESTKPPASLDDVPIDEVEGLDEEVKNSLKAVGVTNASDFESMRARDVDVATIVRDKTEGRTAPSYDNLAAVINKARRRRSAPSVHSLSLDALEDGALALALQGENLEPVQPAAGFPRASLNGEALEVMAARNDRLQLRLPGGALRRGRNPLMLELDPYSRVTLDLNTNRGEAS